MSLQSSPWSACTGSSLYSPVWFTWRCSSGSGIYFSMRVPLSSSKSQWACLRWRFVRLFTLVLQTAVKFIIICQLTRNYTLFLCCFNVFIYLTFIILWMWIINHLHVCNNIVCFTQLIYDKFFLCYCFADVTSDMILINAGLISILCKVMYLLFVW